MSLPINMDFKGGSSEAKSTTTTDQQQRSEGGTRAPIFNIATGGSGLTSSTGNTGMDWTSIGVVAGAAVLAAYVFTRHKK